MVKGVLKVVSTSGADEAGLSDDDIVNETAQALQDKLPALFDMDQLEEHFPTKYEESMNTVIKQECLRYNRLLQVMGTSLTDFRKAIKGLIIMTAELESLSKSMLIN